MHHVRILRLLAGLLLGVLPGAFVAPDDAAPLPESAEPPFPLSAEERAGIEKALPAKAIAAPKKHRRLLIFDLNVGYPGHRSMAHAEVAFAGMGKKTGAFETVISRDPSVFEPETLRRFDAVYLNNTVGNLFTDPRLRKSLVEFVYSGGGLLGTHGTTVAFTRWPGAHEDWPEFGRMLGARGANHRDSDEHVVARFDEPDHPLNRPFGGSFDYRDEFFRVHGPYSRNRVRVLFGIDTERTDMNQGAARGGLVREDDDYALAWVRNYGRGRVFYCTIGHNPYVFRDPLMLKFYLGAIQFALGDLPAPTLPSARLTAAARAREQLGWRLGVTAYSFHKYTAFEAIEKTAELGLSFLGGLSFQKVSKDIPRNFDAELTDEEIEKIRWKLDAAGVRLVTFFYQDIPGNEVGCRRVFEFARKLGIETLISEPKLEALDTIETFCDAYDIQLAIHNHGPEHSPHYWHPEKIASLCHGRSRRIGACADVGYWLRSGVDPVEGVRILGKRLLSVQLHDLDQLGRDGHDVPWGEGVGRTREILETVHHLGLTPTLFGLEYSYDWFDSMPEMADCVRFFDRSSLELAGVRTREKGIGEPAGALRASDLVALAARFSRFADDLPPATALGIEEILAYEENPHFVFVRGRGSLGERRIALLKPATFVIYDVPAGPGARWRLIGGDRPEISADRFSITEGDAVLTGETLLPASRFEATRSGDASSVEVVPDDPAAVARFLLRVDIGSESVAPPKTTFTEKEGTGTLMVTAAERVFELTLPAAASTPGTIAISQAGETVLAERVLPAGVLPHGPEGVRLLERWDGAYRQGGAPAWDIRRPATELREAVERGIIRPGRALVLGCGAGTNAVYLARKGFDVTGIDLAPTALALAGERAREAGVHVRWLLADVLAAPDVGPFDFIFDRGCYHGVRRQGAAAYVGTIGRMSHKDTRFLLLAGNANEPRHYGPPRVDETDLIGDFAGGWDFVWLKETRFGSRDPEDRNGPWAWSVLLRPTSRRSPQEADRP